MENVSHLDKWEPERKEDYYSKREIEQRLIDSLSSYDKDKSVQFAAFDKNKDHIIGLCNYTNIVRGPFQACFLGYSIAKKYEGKGLMFEILESTIDYIFGEKNLHRIMANYVPRNQRSGKLLARLGF